MPVSFVTEALIISGVSLDLVGATVLSHAHNAESALELREEIGGDERALGEKDAIATHRAPATYPAKAPGWSRDRL